MSSSSKFTLKIGTLLIGCLFLLQLSQLQAQEISKKELAQAKRLLADAEELVRVYEFDYALPQLLKYDSLVPKDPLCHYLLGVIYLKTGEEQRAFSKLRYSYSKDSSFERIHYYLGTAFHRTHQFDSAIYYYQTSLVKEEADEKEIKHLVEQCKTGKSLMARPKNIEIYNLGDHINSPYPDFAPVISADESRLIFTSRRPSKEHPDLDPIDNLPYEDVYISEKGKDGKWGKPVNMKEINTPDHDASIGLAPDGDELFIYRSALALQNSGNIYSSVFKNQQWSAPEMMQKGVNSRAQETHAAIMADEQVLFISSDRNVENSRGGKDIYIVRRLPDLTWAEPENLGEVINTPYDEDSPYITPDGKTLYFSSKGHKGMGGFDIFYSKYNEQTNTWGKPVNMGYPINTANDDIFVTWSTDGTRGYFSTNKSDSYGDQDLYIIMLPEVRKKMIVLKGKVIDQATGKAMAATIEIIDNETQKIVNIVNSNSFNGKYAAYLKPNKNYGVRVKHKGYLFASRNIDVNDQFEYLEIKEDFELKVVGDNQMVELENIFFSDGNGMEVLPSSFPELQALKELMDSNPGYRVEVVVHSDNSEDSVLNIYRTKAKAEALVAELVSLGSIGDRLEAKGHGFGSAFPLASNNTNLGRKQNRRIEYVFRKITDDTPSFDYGKIYAKLNIDPALLQKGPTAINTIGDEILLQNSVSFKTGANILDLEAELAIRELVTLMDENPLMKVEVGGHTMAKGDKVFKDSLSYRLASLVAQKLIYNGISKDRIIIKGYGDSELIADGGNTENLQNLRVQFKLLNPEDDMRRRIDELLAQEASIIPFEDLMPGKRLKPIVFFNINSFDISASGYEIIEEAQKILENHPGLYIEIGGHSDSSGAAEFNARLSKKRAEVVAREMLKRGIAPDRFFVKAYGEDAPRYDNNTPEGRVKNRRCEFKVLRMDYAKEKKKFNSGLSTVTDKQ